MDKYVYVDEDNIDPELMCGICQRPLVEPVDLPCSHTFCGACVARLCRPAEASAPPARPPESAAVQPAQCATGQGEAASNRRAGGVNAPASGSSTRHMCPVDRQAFTEAEVVLSKGTVIRLINKLAVLCPHAAAGQSASGGDGAAGQGCAWSGPRSNVPDHLRSCVHYPCPQRVSGCVYRGAAGAVRDHVRDTCGYTAVACRVCGQQAPRSALGPHEEACVIQQRKAVRLAEYERDLERRRGLLAPQAPVVVPPEPRPVPAAGGGGGGGGDRVERGRWGREVAGERLQVVRALRRVAVEAGGRRFDTSVATLRKYPESVLGVWAGEAAPGDCLFVDMDPDVFKLILSWMRR